MARTPKYTTDQAAEKAIEMLAGPQVDELLDKLLPSWNLMETGLGHNIRGIFRTRGDRVGFREAVLQRLSGESGEAMLRRTGANGPDLITLGEELVDAVGKMSNTSIDEIAQLGYEPARAAFLSAFEGSIRPQDDANGDHNPAAGSSHRLRSLLLACHLDADVRQVLYDVLTTRLKEYTPVLEAAITDAGLASRRPVGELLDVGAALLDGFLIRAVAEPGDGTFWADRFATTVVEIARANLTRQESVAAPMPLV